MVFGGAFGKWLGHEVSKYWKDNFLKYYFTGFFLLLKLFFNVKIILKLYYEIQTEE